MIVIDKDIPIPRRRSQNEQYPWHDLQVGDSFFVAGAKLKSLRSSSSQMKRKTNHNYLVREVDGGVRVWRTV